MKVLRLTPGALDTLTREVTARGGHLELVGELSGTSMVPAMQPGDVLSIEVTGPERLRPGDVALYRGAHGRLVAHRVVHTSCSDDAWSARSILVAGDAPGSRQEQVLPSAVIGRVLTVRRGWRLERLARKVLGSILRRCRGLG